MILILEKDIMSILVQARKAELGGGYPMSDRAMMDQVVSRYCIPSRVVNALTWYQSLLSSALAMKLPHPVLLG